MKKVKAPKGITLVALIITIIVLLILAGVAISTIQESNIIKKAQEATKTYKEKEEKEKQILQSYADFIDDKTTDKGINHDAIIKILEDVFNNKITESEALQRLKNEDAIEQDAVSFIDSILVERLINDYDTLDTSEIGEYIYLEKINALYKMSKTDSDSWTFSYVDDPLAYQQFKCIRITRETLEDIFLSGKELPADLIPTNLADLLEPENEKNFLDYIVNNSNGRIKSIGKIDHINSRIYLSDLLLVDENGDEIVLEYVDENGNKITLLFGYDSGFTVALKPENGFVIEIDVSPGI